MANEQVEQQNVPIPLEPIIDSISPSLKVDHVMTKIIGGSMRMVGLSESAQVLSQETRKDADGNDFNVGRVRPVVVMDVDLTAAFTMVVTLSDLLIQNEAWTKANPDWCRAVSGNFRIIADKLAAEAPGNGNG